MPSHSVSIVRVPPYEVATARPTTCTAASTLSHSGIAYPFDRWKTCIDGRQVTNR